MTAYRKERIENALLFFAQEHYKKTKKYVSQTALYKYLAFFEFRCLEKYGEMPLELRYKAMEHGPVPVEVYSKRDDPSPFPLVTFERSKTTKGNDLYVVKPNGQFKADYFSENELTEMQNLIEFFAQRWVDAKVMSDASHQEIRAWRTTYKQQPNAVIDPINNFTRDITVVPVDELQWQEERFLRHRKIMEYVN
jgi:uncharacterized phage-associated protein